MRSFLNRLQILGLQKASGTSEGFTGLTVKYSRCVCGEWRKLKGLQRRELSKLVVGDDTSVALHGVHEWNMFEGIVLGRVEHHLQIEVTCCRPELTRMHGCGAGGHKTAR